MYVIFSPVMMVSSFYTGRFFSFLCRMDTYTHQLVPTTVFWRGTFTNKIYITGYSPVSPTFSPTFNGTTSIPNDRYIRFSTLAHRESLILVERQGQLRVVFDVSYALLRNKQITAATWYMETISQQHQWQGSVLVYAPNNSSYGGEIYGIYLVCRFLHEMWPHITRISREKFICDVITWRHI